MSSIDKDGRVIGHPKPPKRKRKVTRPSGPPESAIQSAVEQYLRLHGIRFIHIPDCVLRLCSPISRIPLWHKKEISQALKGIPDILAFMDDRCLLLELKRKGGRLRQPQKAWLKGLKHHVVDNLTDAVQIINDWRSNNDVP